MVIIGAKGLAKELLVVLQWDGEADNLCLFVTTRPPPNAGSDQFTLSVDQNN